MRAVLVAFVLLVLATACSSTNSTPAPTTSNTEIRPTVRRGDSAAGMAYLQSIERGAAYQKMWQAGEKIANAIWDHKLGDIEVTLSNGGKVDSDYAGWVWVFATKEGRVQASAYIWFEKGVPNFTKGVLGFSLGSVKITRLPEDTYYKMSHDMFDYTISMSPDYFGGVSPEAPYRYPVSVDQAKTYDQAAFDHVEAAMRGLGL